MDNKIIDIRRNKTDLDLAVAVQAELLSGLGASDDGEKRLPDLLLWDEQGHLLFEKVNGRPEYYVHHDEIALLKQYGAEVVGMLEPDSMMVELGSGDLTKICILLDAFEAARKPLRYYALDLGLPNLQRTLTLLPPYKYVTCYGLYGTFDDGLFWLDALKHASPLQQPTTNLGGSVNGPSHPANPTAPVTTGSHETPSPTIQKLILSLGATLGNVPRTSLPEFLRSFAATLTPDRDLMLVSLDGCKDAKFINNAYNDADGINRAFNANALRHANEILGKEKGTDGPVFRDSEWETIGRWNASEGRHEWGYRYCGPSAGTQGSDGAAEGSGDWAWEGLSVKKGEFVRGIFSWNYDEHECEELWTAAGVKSRKRYGRTEEPRHYVHVVTPTALAGAPPAPTERSTR